MVTYANNLVTYANNNKVGDYTITTQISANKHKSPLLCLNTQSGFTLIEAMIVVAIIGILAAIAYPSYQQYVIKSKRTDMMSEMHNIASNIEAQKLQKGGYDTLTLNTGSYPADKPIYNVAVAPLSADWVITATPVATAINANDGNLTLNARGYKCRIISNTDKRCGLNDEWNK